MCTKLNLKTFQQMYSWTYRFAFLKCINLMKRNQVLRGGYYVIVLQFLMLLVLVL